jgi:hypothetical protein
LRHLVPQVTFSFILCTKGVARWPSRAVRGATGRSDAIGGRRGDGPVGAQVLGERVDGEAAHGPVAAGSQHPEAVAAVGQEAAHGDAVGGAGVDRRSADAHGVVGGPGARAEGLDGRLVVEGGRQQRRDADQVAGCDRDRIPSAVLGGQVGLQGGQALDPAGRRPVDGAGRPARRLQVGRGSRFAPTAAPAPAAGWRAGPAVPARCRPPPVRARRRGPIGVVMVRSGIGSARTPAPRSARRASGPRPRRRCWRTRGRTARGRSSPPCAGWPGVAAPGTST